MEVGFRNWKEGCERLRIHENGQQHLIAISKFAAAESSDIAKSLTESTLKAQAENRVALRAICSSLMYLSKQGLSIQGDKDSEGNFMELLRLRSAKIPVLKIWLLRSKNYTSHDIRNEILEIMANCILRSLLSRVKAAKIYSLIVDETTDASTKEQISISFRYIDDDLNPQECFAGLYETASTTGETVTNAVLDALKRFNLPVSCIRGQCYDGGSNMKGKFRGVQARIRELEPRALYVHCFNHSLNLALQDSVRGIPVMRDALQIVHDVSVAIG